MYVKICVSICVFYLVSVFLLLAVMAQLPFIAYYFSILLIQAYRWSGTNQRFVAVVAISLDFLNSK